MEAVQHTHFSHTCCNQQASLNRNVTVDEIAIFTPLGNFRACAYVLKIWWDRRDSHEAWWCAI